MGQLFLRPEYAIPRKIIFHSDFDGICSAALLCKFFNYECELEPITYSIKKSWLRRRLEDIAVVDFLYHPNTMWWFDHHVTSFLSKEIKSKYIPDSQHRWDIKYKSCPSLILDVLDESCDVVELREQFRDWLLWSDIIDSAQYTTPHQAVLGKDPAILINQALSFNSDFDLRRYIIKHIIKGENPIQLSNDSNISIYWKQFREQQLFALKEMEKRIQIIDLVGLCDLLNARVPFVRYGVYLINPTVKYSVIAYGSFKGTNKNYISLSRNPWLKNESSSINLGNLAKSFGGGGRETVASIPFKNVLDCRNTAVLLAKRLSNKIQTKIEVI